MMKLKVCGLTKSEQISELIALNVEFLGFIFYEKSPRFVLKHLSLSQISGIKHSGKVGVFVNESVENIVAIAEDAALNYVQLHGDEDEKFIDELRNKLNKGIKIIKVIRVGRELENLKYKIQKVKSDTDYFLFDTDSKLYGGTGKTFNWQILNELQISKPYFLSGGICLGNFQENQIIHQKPFALDINSKFETEAGNKDLEKIKRLLRILKTNLSHEGTD